MRKRQSYGVFDISPDARKDRRKAEKRRNEVLRQLREEAETEEVSENSEEGFPVREWGMGGDSAPRRGWGAKALRASGVKAAAHTAATAYPFPAGPSLGPNGVYIGPDMNGGGAFCFDPWEAYSRGYISGMSMLLFGTVGTGKSSLAKSFAVRSVLSGRKLAVPSDLKGEWTEVVKRLHGSVIQIGPGLATCLNPLDEGVRPSTDGDGRPMSDEQWEMVVRSRRMAIMETLVKILSARDELEPEMLAALEECLDLGVEQAETYGRRPIIQDLRDVLDDIKKDAEELVASAADHLDLTLRQLTTGQMAGMFNGQSTATFSLDVPAVAIDTSAMRGAAQKVRRIVSACCSSWLEAMVTNRDGGQRLVIYEEGWDSISSKADLERMVNNWKLARDYGIFNILIMHKVSDLNMAGDQGSQMAAMARSLLGDADVKVIYRQDSSALRLTTEEMELNDRERSILKELRKGEGLWRLGQQTFQVRNVLTPAELPLFDTDQRMDKNPMPEADMADVGFAPEPAETVPEWLGV